VLLSGAMVVEIAPFLFIAAFHFFSFSCVYSLVWHLLVLHHPLKAEDLGKTGFEATIHVYSLRLDY